MKSHLGIYSDWVEAARKQAALYPLAAPGEETRRQIRNMLGFSDAAPIEEHANIETTWKRDGLIGEVVSWVRWIRTTNASLVLKAGGS